MRATIMCSLCDSSKNSSLAPTMHTQIGSNMIVYFNSCIFTCCTDNDLCWMPEGFVGNNFYVLLLHYNGKCVTQPNHVVVYLLSMRFCRVRTSFCLLYLAVFIIFDLSIHSINYNDNIIEKT